MQPLNSAKKTNLLISTSTVPTNVSCNIKKDNLEQEFAKDRSHECKNSTENLEKEVNCKTGTLQKVKKTYIWLVNEDEDDDEWNCDLRNEFSLNVEF